MFDEVLELTADNPDIPFKELIGSPRAWAWRSAGRSCSASADRRKADAGMDEAIRSPRWRTRRRWAGPTCSRRRCTSRWRDDRSRRSSDHAQKVFEIAERLGDAFSRSWARLWLGYAALVAGDAERAVEEFTRTLTEIDERGAGREALAWSIAALGSALVAAGRGRPGHRGRSPRRSRCARTSARSTTRCGPASRSAASLLERGSEADVEEAAEQLHVALEIAQRMGHVLYIDLLNRHLERIPTTA